MKRALSISLFLTLGMLSHSIGSAQTATTTSTCEETLIAQDEVIKLLDAQVAELRAAVEARKAQVAALEAQIGTLEEQADVYHKLWLAEAEVAARERKRQMWTEMWTGLKWGGIGLAVGVLAERAVED